MKLAEKLNNMFEASLYPVEIDDKKYTEEELNSMSVIKVKDLGLSDKGITKLPSWVAKCEVSGDFDCAGNRLTSLKGAPKKVGGDFYCDGNKLTSLDGAQKEVSGNFDCNYNNLTSLKGAPQKVGGYFNCHNNRKKFTEEEVRAVSDVKGKIYV